MRKIKMNILVASMITLPSLSMVDFLQCRHLIGCKKGQRKYLVASGIIFQDQRRVSVSGFMVKIAASDTLRRVSGRIVKSNFIETSKNLK
jgi:hypothetical protein